MKGLSFSEPMVKAWMEGRKTVTRRLCKYRGLTIHGSFECHFDGDEFAHFVRTVNDRTQDCLIKPHYHPGETVYIKETWMGTPSCLSYKASDPRQVIEFNYDRWRSPRFMPAWASRSHAKIVSVRPGRVQEITEEEAKREGVDGYVYGHGPVSNNALMVEPGYWHPKFYRAGFEYIWESLHPGTWESNPWVWRIELERID